MTFEEYFELAKKGFKANWPTLTEEEVMAFLTKDKWAVLEIKDSYESHSKQLEEGSITLKQFESSAPGYNLALMYD